MKSVPLAVHDVGTLISRSSSWPRAKFCVSIYGAELVRYTLDTSVHARLVKHVWCVHCAFLGENQGFHSMACEFQYQSDLCVNHSAYKLNLWADKILQKCEDQLLSPHGLDPTSVARTLRADHFSHDLPYQEVTECDMSVTSTHKLFLHPCPGEWGPGRYEFDQIWRL